MLDSIEIQGGENNKMNSSTVINQLKQGLKQDNITQTDTQELKPKLQNDNPQINEEIVNYKELESDQIKHNKNSKSLQNKKSFRGKNAYSNFIKNIRSTTPVLNSMSNLNPNKKIKTSSSLMYNIFIGVYVEESKAIFTKFCVSDELVLEFFVSE